MASTRKTYPDNAEIHARKTGGRKMRAAIGFTEKLAVLDAMRTRVAGMAEARDARRKDPRP